MSKLFSKVISKWQYYIISFLVIILVSYGSISLSARPTKKEKVSIFLTCYKLDDKFQNYIDDFKLDYLEMIEVETHAPNERNYDTYLEAFKNNRDIIIIPESSLDTVLSFSFLRITDDFINEISNTSQEIYMNQEIKCGIKVYSKDTHSGILDNFITYCSIDNEEDYYMFINRKSLHLGEFNNSPYNGAISVLKGFLNDEKENG